MSKPNLNYRYQQGTLGLKKDDRTVSGIFSTDAPVLRYAYRYNDEGGKDQPSGYFNEILSFDSNHIDLSRVKASRCPYLKNHYSLKLGKVTDITLESNLGRFEAKITRSQIGEDYLRDCEDDLSTGVSIGYLVRKYQLVKPPKFVDGRKMELGTYKAVDWLLYEISDCDMPADIDAGLDRALAFTRDDSGLHLIDKEMEMDIEEIQVQLSAKDTEIDQLRSDLTMKDSEIQGLKDQLSDLQSQLFNTETRLTLEQQLVVIRTKLDRLVAEFKITTDERDVLLDVKSDDLATFQSDIDFIERSITLAEKRKPTLNTEIHSDNERSFEPDANAGVDTKAIDAYESAYQ